jgi:hypothetical protein
MEDEVADRPVRRTRFTGWSALGAGLLVAMTPLWRVLTLGPTPTFEEVSQLICRSGQDATPDPQGIHATGAPLNASLARPADELQAARRPVRK